MKKLLAMLLAVAMVFGMVACSGTDAPPAETPASTPADAPADTPVSDAPADVPTDAPESETALKLAWDAGIGTDSRFECPHKDCQCFYIEAVFEPLSWDDHNGGRIPVLATEVTSNEDLTVWTVKLREGVTWHDGEPFTADDVVYSVMYAILAPNTGAMQDFTQIKGQAAVKNGEADTLEGVKVDGMTITFELTGPYLNFGNDIGDLWVLPEHLLGQYDFAEAETCDYWKKPIGTGPYMINEVSFPDYFTCTRYDGYWGEPAGIKNLHFQSYVAGGVDAAVADMVTGNLDLLHANLVSNPESYAYIAESNPDVKVFTEITFYARYTAFNIDARQDGQNKAALANPLARRAIAMMFDAEALSAYVGDVATPAYTLCAPFSSVYNDEIDFDKKNDYETAKAWMEEAGWDFENDIFELAHYDQDQVTMDTLTMIQQNLAKIGVKCELKLLSGNLAEEIYTKANYDALHLAISFPASDPARIYQQLTPARAYSFMGNDEEIFGIFSPVFDAYSAATSLEEQAKYAKELQALNAEHCYIIPEYWYAKQECYDTTKVSIPDAVFEYYNDRNKFWSEWEILY